MKKSILETVHEGVKDLHKSGLADKITMRDFDALCLPPVKEFTPQQIKQIREGTGTSQQVFAAYLNISKETVQKWEQGVKKPGGAALKLVNLVEKNGLRIVAQHR